MILNDARDKLKNEYDFVKGYRGDMGSLLERIQKADLKGDTSYLTEGSLRMILSSRNFIRRHGNMVAHQASGIDRGAAIVSNVDHLSEEVRRHLRGICAFTYGRQSSI